MILEESKYFVDSKKSSNEKIYLKEIKIVSNDYASIKKVSKCLKKFSRKDKNKFEKEDVAVIFLFYLVDILELN